MTWTCEPWTRPELCESRIVSYNIPILTIKELERYVLNLASALLWYRFIIFRPFLMEPTKINEPVPAISCAKSEFRGLLL